MNNLQEFIDSRFLPFVEKPVRYIGNELNIVRKDLSLISLHGVLCFPETYEIGMSHFGLQALYHIVNSRNFWALSRCFHPMPDAQKLLRSEKIPLYCLEYMLPLSKADWVGFTVQYELQYTNILNMLDLGGIPLFSRERDENCPIIIAGGPCMNNPEPVADFIDAFAIGDGEETIIALCEVMDQCKKNKSSRTRTLETIAKIKGVYVPSLFSFEKKGLFEVPVACQSIIKAAKIPELKSENYPDRPLVPLINVVHHRLAVEVMRGCTRGCRFCSAGMFYRPVRERSLQDIYGQISRSIGSTGWRDIGLLSLSTADYSNLTELFKSIAALAGEHHLEVSVPSTRIDALTNDQMNMLESITPISSFTLAPEAGSARLRAIINKDFSDEVIYNAVEMLMQRNVQTVKLYFMIGLPTEGRDDLEAMVRLIKGIAQIVRKTSRRRTVNVAISPFSPKPQTPFQWEAMDAVDVLMEKSRYIKQSLCSERNVKVSYREPAMAYLETVMARGDRRVSQLIHEAWKNGAQSDGWDEYFNVERWKRAAEKVSITMDIYTSMIPLDQTLPWSIVSNGVSNEFLADDRTQALNGQFRSDCRNGHCYACGVCDSNTGRNIQIESKFPAAASCNKVDLPVKSAAPESCSYYRYKYAKIGEMRFLGSRDMMNIFNRAFIAAGIPLAFSKGYHPHPRIAFGPPLPFGVIGLSELFDIVTTRPVSNDDLLSINKWLPKDLKTHNWLQLHKKEESLNTLIEASEYTFVPSFKMSVQELNHLVENTLSRRDVLVPIKENDTQASADTLKNIRPLIHGIGVQNKGMAPVITAVLSNMPKATCRPSDFLAGLFPDHQFTDFIVCRKECLQNESGNLIPLWKDSI
jgi:radical SAM family uncharacterized protein/radical SAM-linked protein